MTVKIRNDYIVHGYRRVKLHGQYHSSRSHPSEWVSERGLRSRDFESDLATEEPTTEVRRETNILRNGRGSLRGKLVIADDWDSSEVNEAIARDFGLDS
jgi:hypothetical protein